jgi:amidase
VIDIAGMPTRAGSRALDAAPPAARHADAVEAVLAAGCRIVGKANLHELAFGVTGVNRHTGTPANPHYPALVPGGSSSGSATSVAAGLADFALGTDTGGSIRVPAACCAVVGLKPTFGRLSRRGLVPAESSLDCVGPLARDVATLASAMGMLDPGFVPLGRPERPRLGLVAAEAQEEVLVAIRTVLRSADCDVVQVQLPGIAAAFEAGMTIMNAEMWAAFGHLVSSGALGTDVEARLRAASRIRAEEVAASERVRTQFSLEVDTALAEVDALVLPTLPTVPLRLESAGDSAAALGMTRLVRPFNLSGHPALSLPASELAHGPVSLQLVGRKWDDARVCAIASQIERTIAVRPLSLT